MPRDNLLLIPFNIFAVFTGSLPLFALLVNFVTAVIFQFDKVNDTECGASNFIPSISAITGISPQRYLWRISVALHSAPRFIVTLIYYNYYMSFLCLQKSYKREMFYTLMAKLLFLLSIIENVAMLTTTYISNVENYPIHEKFFIAFMISSCVHMLFTIIIFKMARGDTSFTELEKKSYEMKIMFFTTVLLCTVGLLYFYYKHKVLCEANAFSWFSVCEYGIALCNMGFHMTGAFDFKEYSFLATSQHTVDKQPDKIQ